MLDTGEAMVTGQQYTFWFAYAPSGISVFPPGGGVVQGALNADGARKFSGVVANTALRGPGNIAATFTWQDQLDDTLGAPLSVATAGQQAAELINGSSSFTAANVDFVQADLGNTQGLNLGSTLWIIGGAIVLVVILAIYQDVREV